MLLKKKYIYIYNECLCINIFMNVGMSIFVGKSFGRGLAMSMYVCILIDLFQGFIYWNLFSQFFYCTGYILQRLCVKSRIEFFLLLWFLDKEDYVLRPLLIIWVLLFWIMFLYLCFSYFILVHLLFSYYLEEQCILYTNPSSVVFTHMHVTNIFPILSYFVLIQAKCTSYFVIFEVCILACVVEMSKTLLGSHLYIIKFIDVNRIYSHQVVFEKRVLDRTHHMSKVTLMRSHMAYLGKILAISCAGAYNVRQAVAANGIEKDRQVLDNGESLCFKKELGNGLYSIEEPYMGMWNDHICILLEVSDNHRNSEFEKFRVRWWLKLL